MASPRAPSTGGHAPPRAGEPCGGLARVLARVFRESRPEILDLGPLCGESVVYLARRGARVHVEEVEPPRQPPPPKPGETAPVPEPFRLDQPDATMDLVLAWEVADFVPPARLPELGSELKRVLRVGGHVFLFSHARPPVEMEPPPRYVLLADDLLVREASPRSPRRRWVHATRDLERALAGFSVEGIQLRRSQMREIGAVRVNKS